MVVGPVGGDCSLALLQRIVLVLVSLRLASQIHPHGVEITLSPTHTPCRWTPGCVIWIGEPVALLLRRDPVDDGGPTMPGAQARCDG